MAQKFLLSCPSCGTQIPVELSQAGERIVCTCGTQLEVPAMRHIRELPRAATDTPKAVARKSWPLAYGLIFALGLVVMVGGLAIAGYYQWGRSQLHTEETKWDDIKAAERAIDALPVDIAFEQWKQIRDYGLGPQTPPEFVVHRRVSRIWFRIILGALGVAAVGLMLIVLALVLPRPAPKQRPRPRPRHHH